MPAEGTPTPAPREKPTFRIHWHVILTHFPVSAFTGAFIFMGLHLLLGDACWPRAAYVALLAGTVVLVPTTITGLLEWRSTYKRFMNKVFRYKLRIAAGMVPLSIALAVYQTFVPFDDLAMLPHLLYFGGLGLLVLGSMAEGYYGGRLHHR